MFRGLSGFVLFVAFFLATACGSNEGNLDHITFTDPNSKYLLVDDLNNTEIQVDTILRRVLEDGMDVHSKEVQGLVLRGVTQQLVRKINSEAKEYGFDAVPEDELEGMLAEIDRQLNTISLSEERVQSQTHASFIMINASEPIVQSNNNGSSLRALQEVITSSCCWVVDKLFSPGSKIKLVRLLIRSNKGKLVSSEIDDAIIEQLCESVLGLALDQLFTTINVWADANSRRTLNNHTSALEKVNEATIFDVQCAGTIDTTFKDWQECIPKELRESISWIPYGSEVLELSDDSSIRVYEGGVKISVPIVGSQVAFAGKEIVVQVGRPIPTTYITKSLSIGPGIHSDDLEPHQINAVDSLMRARIRSSADELLSDTVRLNQRIREYFSVVYGGLLNDYTLVVQMNLK